MHIIDKIIKKRIGMLLEKEVRTSLDAGRLASMLSRYNFLLPNDMGGGRNETMTLYYAGQDGLRRDFDKLSDIVERAGWTVSFCGNYYDGLRNVYLRYRNNHPEFNKGTFFVCLETEYGQKMDDYFGTDEDELLNDDELSYGEDRHLGVRYKRGIFYHITRREYLRSILAHGLRPKNGGGITNWRDTSDRLYLSLLPDFRDVEIYPYDDEEETGEDPIILKIDLRGKMDSFDFYVDQHYSNAVYTYSDIPPKFIEVLDVGKVNQLWSAYMVRDCIKRTLDAVIEHNFKGYRESDIVRALHVHREQVYQVIRKRVDKMLDAQEHVNYSSNIRDEIMKCIDGYHS